MRRITLYIFLLSVQRVVKSEYKRYCFFRGKHFVAPAHTGEGRYLYGMCHRRAAAGMDRRLPVRPPLLNARR